jgi:flagellar protein FliS
MNPYLKQYQKNEVETATPEKILILLYDGAIQFLNKAKIAFEEKNIQEIHNNIMGCEKIILEFINTVDMDNGGDFAVRITALYRYFYETLIQANLKRDVTKVDEVLRHLVELRATWKQAIAIANSQKTSEIQIAQEEIRG